VSLASKECPRVNCARLGCNAASSGNPLPTCRDNVSVPSSRVKKSTKMGQIRCPEPSVKDYHTTLRYNPAERSSHPHRGGSLKSQCPRVSVPLIHAWNELLDCCWWKVLRMSCCWRIKLIIYINISLGPVTQHIYCGTLTPVWNNLIFITPLAMILPTRK
jgi:hypothetical protein